MFLPLGGSNEIGMNMNLYGFGPEEDRQWIMVDCGVTFGDETTPGVDLICADPDYIVSEKADILALILTHAHEDHIGAVALLWPQFRCPVYATAFTAAMVRRKFEEAGVPNPPLHVVELGARLTFGPFDIEYVTLTHSIPEPNGLAIRTPLGLVFHTGDWKIDPNPTLGEETDVKRLTELGEEGVLAMVCDSTNVFSAGEAGSELAVRDSLTDLIGAQKGRVAVTTFASNLARVLSVCKAAACYDRSVCLLGRSMLRVVEIARDVGLLPKDARFIGPEDAGYLPKDKVLYLCTGSQGEPRAALSRIARDDHRDLALSEGDTVIFSSRIIPGNERSIFNLQNQLVELGVKVITEKDHFIHVSGHPCRDELKRMYGWVRPKISVPVHGETRHINEHAAYALELGVPDVIEPANGTMIRLAPDGPEIIDEVPAGRLFLDGRVLTPEGDAAMRMRKRLAYGGCVALAVVLDEKNRLAAPVSAELLGLPAALDQDGGRLTVLIEEEVEAALDRARRKDLDDASADMIARRAARGVVARAWGKKPEALVSIVRI